MDGCDETTFRGFASTEYGCNYLYTAAFKLFGGATTDPFAESCKIPTHLSNKHCTNAENKDHANNANAVQYKGEEYGADSRCFLSDVSDRRVTFGSENGIRCYRHECYDNGTKIKVLISGEWYDIDPGTNEVNVVNRGTNT